MAATPEAICNQALILLGLRAMVGTVAAPDTTVDRDVACAALYAQTRDATEDAAEWNELTVRATLYAYSAPATTMTPGAGATVVDTTGVTFTAGATGIFFTGGVSDVGKRIFATGTTGKATITAHSVALPAATLTPAAGALTVGTTGVIFTASAAVLAAGNVGKIIENLAGVGLALVTGFTDTTHVTATILEAFPSVAAIASQSWQLVATDVVTATITEAFPSLAAIAAAAWRLYGPAPAWDTDFLYTITLPTDWLRGYEPAHQPQDQVSWRREGAVIVCSEETLNILYVKKLTDVTLFTPRLTEAIVYHLAAKLCEAGLGNAAKGDRFWNLYGAKLKQAKGLDRQEGTRARYQPTSYVDVRRGSR
jgi:hypothetical protein